MTLAKSIREAMGNRPPRVEPDRQVTAEAAAPPPARTMRSRKPKPSRPVDGLATAFPARPAALINIAPAHADTLDTLDMDAFSTGYVPVDRPSSSPFMRSRIPAPRGPAEIVARLRRRGIELVPTIDGAFAVRSRGGALDIPTRDAITAAGPLLRAYLHGTPLRCAMPAHVGGEPPEATTLTVGGAGWCGECS